MPRVRLRSVDPLVNGGSSLCSRWIHWLNGGEHWTHHHLSVFLLTFFSFAFIHASRKTLSTVKPSVIAAWTHNASGHEPLFPNEAAASEYLALLDGGFMFAYALGLFGGGILGDCYDPKVVLAFGMGLSAISTFSFGYLTEVFGVYSKTLYAFLWIASGLFQSVGWPTEVCIMGNWFGHGSRGAVLGLWSACASVGNIIGTLVSSRLLVYGYQYPFAVNSVLLFLFAFLVYFCLPSTPSEIGLEIPPESPGELHNVLEVRGDLHERPKPIGFFRAWMLPGVLAYSLAYACLKLVNYGFFFWLPFYLHSNFGWDEADADALSTWYDVGGIIAAVAAGSASDHFPSRTPIIVSMLFVSIFALFAYAHSPSSYLVNGILLAITGFFIGGPANMISGSVSADLGKSREIRGNSEALSTVTGIVDGTGSTGAAFGQLLIPAIHNAFGWNFVFYGFMFMMLCTTLCLLPLLLRELWSRRLYSSRSSEADDETEDLLQRDENVRRRRSLSDVE